MIFGRICHFHNGRSASQGTKQSPDRGGRESRAERNRRSDWDPQDATFESQIWYDFILEVGALATSTALGRFFTLKTSLQLVCWLKRPKKENFIKTNTRHKRDDPQPLRTTCWHVWMTYRGRLSWLTGNRYSYHRTLGRHWKRHSWASQPVRLDKLASLWVNECWRSPTEIPYRTIALPHQAPSFSKLSRWQLCLEA